jgi:hypothetical protein
MIESYKISMKLQSLSGRRTFQDLIFVFGVRKQGLTHKELLGEMSIFARRLKKGSPTCDRMINKY